MKLLKWLFGKNKNEGMAEIETFSMSMDEYKASRDAEQLRAKLEWEDANEKQKKLDSCYLGTRKKAFYGTYEEYKESKQSSSLALLQNMAMSNLAAQQNMSLNNGYRGYLGAASHNIFG